LETTTLFFLSAIRIENHNFSFRVKRSRAPERSPYYSFFHKTNMKSQNKLNTSQKMRRLMFIILNTFNLCFLFHTKLDHYKISTILSTLFYYAFFNKNYPFLFQRLYYCFSQKKTCMFFSYKKNFNKLKSYKIIKYFLPANYVFRYQSRPRIILMDFDYFCFAFRCYLCLLNLCFRDFTFIILFKY
jgi:hypothetical protein